MNHAQLSEAIKTLKLGTVAENLLATSVEAEKKKLTYEQFLSELLQLEVEHRREKRKHELIKQSKISSEKSLLDYKARPESGVTTAQLMRLAEGQWLKKGTNVVLYGDIGVGKTHIATGLVRSLCEKGFRCLFQTTTKIIEDLCRAKRDLSLGAHFKKLDAFDLLVSDELGYIPHTSDGAELFFQLISHRYERKSILITTNLPYSDWGKVFNTLSTTVAAVDRIVHHCETISIMGPSGRSTFKEEIAGAETGKK